MDNRFKRVCVIGLGYVGLPAAAIMAKHGVEVVGVDIDPERIEAVNSGSVSLIEPGLGGLARAAVAADLLRAQDTPVPADAFIIAVPTPVSEGHAPDLSYVRQAVDSVATVIQAGNLVVLESTLPLGATEVCCEWLASARTDLSFPHEYGSDSDIRVAYCPERVLPGKILSELVGNDRILGGVTSSCASAAADLYSVFVKGVCHTTTARVAELSKLAENAYRDVNIAFANEISMVSETLGINPWEVIDLANRHPRVDILKPGTGVGGHCIPVDPWFIVHSAPSAPSVIRSARQVNDRKPRWVADQAAAVCEKLQNPVVACLGLAYKADTDDLRNSPAIEVVQRIHSSITGRILVVEPHITELPPELSEKEGLELTDLKTALNCARVILPLTDHTEFMNIDIERLGGKEIVDARGIWQGA